MPRSCRSPSRSTERTRPRAAALLLGALAALPAAAQQAVTNTVGLSFGAFTAGAGGTLTVGSTGARSSTGGVLLVNQGAGAAAQFMLSGGSSSEAVSISLPADGTVQLSNGSQTMTLSGFTSTLVNGNGMLSMSGTGSFSVGATLSVGASQAAGNYSGNFSVTVNYN
ncbi:MAG: DUF4402 domain-containing protein [Pelomonas sp.]|nr:DUF4402 domain-containing protein [Roseateles sp.]